MVTNEKLSGTSFNPINDIQTSFVVVGENESTAIDAVLLVPDENESHVDPNFVIGVQDFTIGQEEIPERRYLKIPRRIKESRETAIEYYDSHEALIKGVGAIAIAAGVVKTGSFIVRRHRKHYVA